MDRVAVMILLGVVLSGCTTDAWNAVEDPVRDVAFSIIEQGARSGVASERYGVVFDERDGNIVKVYSGTMADDRMLSVIRIFDDQERYIIVLSRDDPFCLIEPRFSTPYQYVAFEGEQKPVVFSF